MDTLAKSNQDVELQESAGGLSRRAVLLMTATVAAGAAASMSGALAQTAPAASFGAPIVELHVPAGLLTLEQKSAMVKGFTDVVLGAMKLPPDPARRLFVAIMETAEGGFGVNGQVFVPPSK
ncbi:MAG TPA: tautomerase family protein [Bryobacteraceae bacterium]|nr:tautomerase family protein [Bryobacteraceae bacterium]